MKEWFKENFLTLVGLSGIVTVPAAIVLLVLLVNGYDNDNIQAAEQKFEHNTGLIFTDKRCEVSGNSKICWFKIPVFSPAFGCKSTITAIYKCTTQECTWLEEP